jgi:phospholipid-binding lipoprotein MlaA
MSRLLFDGRCTLLWVLALHALVLGGCSANTARPDYDPLEGMNRGIFWFNDKADVYVLEPVARGWDFLTPRRVQDSVRNFFYNMRFPINTVNNILQLDARETGVHLARFMINTTFGVAGIFDPATDWGLVVQEEDFGQTLGRYGVGPGPYLVIPIFGPSCLRDVTRYPVDGFISGVGFTGYGNFFAGAYVVEAVNFRAQNLDTIARAKEASLDYYSAVRNLYLQRRQALINDSNVIPNQFSEELYDVDEDDTIPPQ